MYVNNLSLCTVRLTLAPNRWAELSILTTELSLADHKCSLMSWKLCLLDPPPPEGNRIDVIPLKNRIWETPETKTLQDGRYKSIRFAHTNEGQREEARLMLRYHNGIPKVCLDLENASISSRGSSNTEKNVMEIKTDQCHDFCLSITGRVKILLPWLIVTLSVIAREACPRKINPSSCDS